MKRSKAEEEYFFQQDVEKRRRLAEERRREIASTERELQKKLHWMHCPKCGEVLQAVHFGKIEIDRCFGCKGLWLDDGQLEKLIEQDERQEKSLFSTIFSVFEAR